MDLAVGEFNGDRLDVAIAACDGSVRVMTTGGVTLFDFIPFPGFAGGANLQWLKPFPGYKGGLTLGQSPGALGKAPSRPRIPGYDLTFAW